MHLFTRARAGFAALAVLLAGAAVAAAATKPFLLRPEHITGVASAVPTSGPARGDQNPYGVALVTRTVGRLTKGDILVSNFNNQVNEQGTGSSIVEISPSGSQHVFAVVPRPTGTPAVGLTTALVELRNGFVVVGSLPAPGGMSSAIGPGALSILNSQGHVVRTIRGGDINGPWDMTAVDGGKTATLFVTNVLNGTVAANGGIVRRGTVARISLSGVLGGGTPHVTDNRVIASGFGERTDPAALVVGPTGVGLGGGTLYVADSVGNRIGAVTHALTRTAAVTGGGLTVARGAPLNDPLGLVVVPGGSLVITNGGNGRALQVTPAGHFAAGRTLVPSGAGDLFGLALDPSNQGLYFVNDAGDGPGANSLEHLH